LAPASLAVAAARLEALLARPVARSSLAAAAAAPAGRATRLQVMATPAQKRRPAAEALAQ
jgi:hypothetical protein